MKLIVVLKWVFVKSLNQSSIKSLINNTGWIKYANRIFYLLTGFSGIKNNYHLFKCNKIVNIINTKHIYLFN